MKPVAAYMAYKSGEKGGGDRRSEYREPGMREYTEPGMREYDMRRNEYGGAESRVYSAARQPNQYTRRNEMAEDWPEDIEMRRRRDSRGRYMMDEDMPPEDRYRGRNGRWRSGSRRSAYDGLYDNYPTDRRMADDEEEKEVEKKKYDLTIKPSNVIEWPYAPAEPHEPPEGRMIPRRIGFGAENHMGEHHIPEDMEPGMYGMEDVPEFNREIAEEWVSCMNNEDKAHPHGGKWSAEALKPMAQKYNIPTEGKRFWEFYAMTNAMYSDYSEVAKKFGITSPEFYVCMAKAFMADKDAEPDKVARYYEYIAKK